MLTPSQIRFLEIVTPDVEGTLKIFENSGPLTFSQAIPELGNARVAAGAELAHDVLEIPGRGKFSIFFHGENQFGYWQDK